MNIVIFLRKITIFATVTKLLSICAAAVLVASACTAGRETTDGDTSLVHAGDRVPTFSIAGVTGGAGKSTILNSPADFEGRKSLLVLFNRDCSDCQKAMPRIVKAAAEHPELHVAAIERASNQDTNPYPTLPFYPDPAAVTFKLFAQYTIPRVYLIDETGTIKQLFIERLPDDFEKLTSQL